LACRTSTAAYYDPQKHSDRPCLPEDEGCTDGRQPDPEHEVGADAAAHAAAAAAAEWFLGGEERLEGLAHAPHPAVHGGGAGIQRCAANQVQSPAPIPERQVRACVQVWGCRCPTKVVCSRHHLGAQ